VSGSSSIRACRDCGYDLAGLESSRCPECGGEVPIEQTLDHVAAQSHAASRGLKCRYCKKPLSDMIDGVCACGAKYQLATTSPPPRPTIELSILDGITVIAAIIGCAIALLAFIFTGTARNSDPKWGAILLASVPALGMFLAIATSALKNKLAKEVRSVINWFFLVISAVCLLGAVVLLS
jgi:hypothetical protein